MTFQDDSSILRLPPKKENPKHFVTSNKLRWILGVESDLMIFPYVFFPRFFPHVAVGPGCPAVGFFRGCDQPPCGVGRSVSAQLTLPWMQLFVSGIFKKVQPSEIRRVVYIYIYNTYCISDFWQEKEASLLTSFDNHFVCHSLDSSTAIVVGLFACGMEWIWSCHSVTRGRGTMLPVRWCGCSSHFFFPNKLMKKWRGCIAEMLDGLAKRCKKQWSRQMEV